MNQTVSILKKLVENLKINESLMAFFYQDDIIEQPDND